MKTRGALPLALTSPPPSAISGAPTAYARWSRMLSPMANDADFRPLSGRFRAPNLGGSTTGSGR